MNIQSKLNTLDQIYAIYDSFIADRQLACKELCSHCCTTKVTLTTLEGYQLISTLAAEKQTQLIADMEAAADRYCFQPSVTINQIADICARGDDPPQEMDESSAECPLLVDNLCGIYPLRPFNCRCFVSRTYCGEAGFADVDDFVLTVNTVFLQTLEHVDTGGCTGNLADVVATLALEDNRRAYETESLQCTHGLVPNHNLKILMVPPAHVEKIQPILKALQGIRV